MTAVHALLIMILIAVLLVSRVGRTILTLCLLLLVGMLAFFGQ